jgi:hypothetical protein
MFSGQKKQSEECESLRWFAETERFVEAGRKCLCILSACLKQYGD